MPLQLLQGDVWGLALISSIGSRYYISFVDAYSRLTWLYFLANISDATSLLKSFQDYAETQVNCQIKAIQIDNGGEFLRSFHSNLISPGTLHRLTCPYTSQPNGNVENKHRHIVELVLTLVAQSYLPFKFLFDTVVYLVNRLPSHVIDNLPSYIFVKICFNKLLSYSLLRVFGCLSFPQDRDLKKKLITG